jgi:hypothetical protein
MIPWLASLFLVHAIVKKTGLKPSYLRLGLASYARKRDRGMEGSRVE